MAVPRPAPLARLLGLWLVVLAVAAPLVPWSHDDPTDEVEWTAIAILHWQQLTRGGEPAGLEFEDAAGRAAGAWRSGAQRTLFGFPSANLPKLVWGALLDLSGERRADAIVFDTFEHRDRLRGVRAERELERAVRIARGITFAMFGLSGALLVLLARRLVEGRPGWACGAFALVLWLATPAVRDAATFVRGDWFMVAGTLATLLAALRLRAALAGEHGLRALVGAGALLGLLCGLTVSAKLNGVFVVPLVLLWAALQRAPTAPVGPAARAAALAAIVGVLCATFLVLHPYLWSGPLSGIEATLERWRWMRTFLREDWSVRTGLTAPLGFADGLRLFLERLCVRDDPWRALCGLPLRPALLPLSAFAVGAIALRARDVPQRGAALLALLGMCVIGLGTAAWLPIDWPRYWLPALALACLVEAGGTLSLATWAVRSLRRGKAGTPQVP